MGTPGTPKYQTKDVWIGPDDASIDAFLADISLETNADEVPGAAEILSNIPIYAGETVRAAGASQNSRLALMAEWNRIFDRGPGVIVIRDAIPEKRVLNRATSLFENLIASERETGSGGGDHFAKPGANDRVWNAAQKHCLADPENFAEYFSSDAIAMASHAWLGRGYQLTAQVNRVNPGGAAQTAHRDYHLGFMSAEQLAAYPVQAHLLSPALTLQGAIAHCDMPVESGPTMLLPYSQRFREGYAAFGRPEFQAAFAKHRVQLPLAKGDAVFFNPALMHAAGTNHTTDIFRMANLLQIGSAFGRSVESVDRTRMAKALFPVLAAGNFSTRDTANIIAASAEGYAFPTNLDRDPPVGGLIPKSQAERLADALATGMSPADFANMLDAYDESRSP